MLTNLKKKSSHAKRVAHMHRRSVPRWRPYFEQRAEMKPHNYDYSISTEVYSMCVCVSCRLLTHRYSLLTTRRIKLTSPACLSVHRESFPSCAGSRQRCRGWRAAADTVWSPLWSPRYPPLHKHTERQKYIYVSVNPKSQSWHSELNKLIEAAAKKKERKKVTALWTCGEPLWRCPMSWCVMVEEILEEWAKPFQLLLPL